MAVHTKLIPGTVEFAGSELQMRTVDTDADADCRLRMLIVTKTSILNKNTRPVDLVIHTFCLKL